MDREARWAGIDTSTRTFAICIVDSDGAIVDRAEVSADAERVKQVLSVHSHALDAVAVETGRTSIHLARALLAAGYPVKVYDASRIHRFLQLRANKTDTNDARGIAEAARVGGATLRPVYLKPVDIALVREKLVIRERLIRVRKENEKALMNLLNSYGVRAVDRITSFSALRRNVLSMLAQIEENCDIPIRAQIMPLLDLSQVLRRQEARLEREIGSYASRSEICSRMMAMPGVGPITATSFVTAIGDPTRFGNSSDVGAYLGLTPRVWQTGRYRRQSRITKWGNSLTRKHLHIAARTALSSKTESSLKDWALQLADRINRRKATIALARKMAVVLLAMWKNGSTFDPHGTPARREKLA